MVGNPFTDDHQAFRRTVRQWVEKELKPHALAWDEAEEFPRDVFKQAGDLGLLGIRHKPEAGGSGLDYWYVVAFAEELVRAENAGVGMALLVQAEMATPIIGDLGTREQIDRFLKPALAGDTIAALAISEPDAGSDVASIRTTARRDGDDYVIDGGKMWITNGTRADFLTLAVRTGEPGYGGISLVTFPTDVKGFSVGKKLKKLGNHASDTAILSFDGCRIPRRFLLGEENAGFFQIMVNFQGERLVSAITANAGSEHMIELAIRYGQERKAFGRPVGAFQVWRHKLVEHQAAVEAGKRLCYHAAWMFEEHLRGRAEPPVREISLAKLYCGDLAQKVAYDCQQLFGGMGYVVETPIARAWRDVRLITIGGGTSEIMKEIVSKLSGM